MNPGTYHVPVLADASISGIGAAELPSGIYVDATFGGGGHSRLILEALDSNGQLFGFDQDADAHANALPDERFTLIPENFRHTRNFLRLNGVRRIDGLLADLGVSSHQFDEGTRGFSIRFDAPLDMRMNQYDGLSAADIAATYTVKDLTRIFRLYGELKRPDKVAHAIAHFREDQRIARTGDLMEATKHLAPSGKENQFHAQVFQAFRIEVNDELGALKALLESSIHLMEEGGRLAVISYHSLEDRLVKHFMRSGNFEDDIKRDLKGATLCPFAPLNRKAIVADKEEQVRNPRSRSARLRVATRTALSLDEINSLAA
ncbi:MAG: 16S rRNA (cytosine(1402)-N(4))-methyltransferase [Crocinitomicaceae bacterium]|nr:16S rRNA (cytosine(1402)-N(4))-methyltransferase [Crocinitomicaceae bacterium]